MNSRSINNKTENNIILIWSSSFPPVTGGLESAAKEYALYMKEQGWDVHIITNKYPRHLSEQDYLDGIEVKRYFFFHSPINYIRNRRLDLFFAWLFLKPVTLYKLIIHFFQTRPDVVNLHFPDHQLFECLLMKYIFDFKLIISLHGNEVERMRKLRKSSLRYSLYYYLFKSAICITGCSQYLLDQFHASFLNLSEKKYLPVHNGVSRKFGEQTLVVRKSDYIFTAARFVPKKGLDLLFKATCQVTGGNLLIAGGDENDLLDIGLKKREGVILLGPLSQDELAKHLAQNKITVIPSKKEPYGIIVAEALCCGSPVVATNVGGIPEVIALAKKNLNSAEKIVFDSWVRLVEPNIESIRNGINYVLSNSNSINEYLALVPKFHSQFLWVKRLNKFYRLLIEYL